jgi:hypothetical protein
MNFLRGAVAGVIGKVADMFVEPEQSPVQQLAFHWYVWPTRAVGRQKSLFDGAAVAVGFPVGRYRVSLPCWFPRKQLDTINEELKDGAGAWGKAGLPVKFRVNGLFQ